MTGESRPVRAQPGAAETGSRRVIEATAVGSDTQFAAMGRLVKNVQTQKAGAQRLADRVVAVFVPNVFASTVDSGMV